MAITTCTVSGTLKTVLNTALSDVTVEAYCTQPFFHTDGTHIVDYGVSTTTDANGAWSLVLIETTSISKSLTVAFEFPTGSVERKRREYHVVVPATATANFSDIASET